MSESLKPVVESLLFVAGEPLALARIQDALELKDPGPVREALVELAADYERRGGGFYLDEVAGGYQIRTRPQYRDAIRRLLSAGGTRLSRAAMETLAIVAYRQPAMRSDIDHVRGVDSGGVLRVLLERKLIRVLGRKEIPGRPLVYGTTRQFLEVFGLRDLKDLPTLKEIAAMGEADGESGTEADGVPEGDGAISGSDEPAPRPADVAEAGNPEPESPGGDIDGGSDGGMGGGMDGAMDGGTGEDSGEGDGGGKKA
jgi:segregation and condensation protein B